MSAELNYSQCPQCLLRASHKLKTEMADQYGKISQEKWLELKAELDKEISLVSDEGLRECSDITMNNQGILTVSYKATCCICSFTHETSYEENALLKKEVE